MVKAEPFGYITEGPLYGWQAEEKYKRTNNAFYPPHSNQFHVDDNDPNRKKFDTHIWVEVNIAAANQADRVVDVCHGLYKLGQNPDVVLPAGQYNRQDYLLAATRPPPGKPQPERVFTGMIPIPYRWPRALRQHA